jgi:hypothetical protein
MPTGRLQSRSRSGEGAGARESIYESGKQESRKAGKQENRKTGKQRVRLRFNLLVQ